MLPRQGSRDLLSGTLRAILRQAQLTRGEFLDLL
jgi:predicted RNA binding protein YcfA (HicA-like mRNA interferase family)